MSNDFIVKKKPVDLIAGIICSILFMPFFILIVIFHFDDPVEIPLKFVLLSFLLVLLGLFCIYDGIRPKISVKDGIVIYYPKFKLKREICPYEITSKSRETDKSQISSGAAIGGAIGGALGGIIGALIGKNTQQKPVEIISYSSHGKIVLSFKTNMKNADMLEAYIDSKRPQFQEISE